MKKKLDKLDAEIIKLITGNCRQMKEIGASRMTKTKYGVELQGVVVEIDKMKDAIKKLLTSYDNHRHR